MHEKTGKHNELKKRIHFGDNENIPVKTANQTCGRCPIPDCKVRAAKAIHIEKENKTLLAEEKIKEMDELKLPNQLQK